MSWGERVLAVAGPGQGSHLAVTAAVLVAAVRQAAWNAHAAASTRAVTGIAGPDNPR